MATSRQPPLTQPAPRAESELLLPPARCASAPDLSRARAGGVPQKRTVVRSKAFLKAQILVQNLPAMDCVVRNVSLSGARLEVDETFALPREFELELPQRGTVLLCELRWRRNDRVGVRFLGPRSPRAPTNQAMEELRSENTRLRRENARLKARIEELTGGF